MRASAAMANCMREKKKKAVISDFYKAVVREASVVSHPRSHFKRLRSQKKLFLT